MRKYYFFPILIFHLISIQSCKKIDENKLKVTTVNYDTIKSNLKKTTYNNTKDTFLIGDYLISQKKIIKNINSTCVSENSLAISNSYKKKCTYYKIKFPYEELNTIDNKVIQSFNGINFSIKKSKETSDADDFAIKNLIIQKEGISTDSIRIYSYENYIEALVQKKEYYYLDNNHLWILKLNIDEEGIKVVNWNYYTINNNGKIVLEKLKNRKEKIKKKTFPINSIIYAQVDTYLNMRSAPNMTAAIVGKANPQDALIVLEILEGWVKINLNGTEGYVSSEFVK